MENTNKGKTKFTPSYDEDQIEYDIDRELKKELEDQGLEYRFIDFKKAKLNGGMSRAGWRIYVRKSPDPRTSGISVLADPDNLVRNGSMVLAVKTKQAAGRQRARRDAQNSTLRHYNKTVAEELKKDVRKLGSNSKLIQGYENNS
jgi:hypothetical protein